VSKADDFEARYRDVRNGRSAGSGGNASGEYDALGGYHPGHGTHGGHGGHGVTVDYDLGYDANGWDTQGFRSVEADYLDGQGDAPAGGRLDDQLTGHLDDQVTGYQAAGYPGVGAPGRAVRPRGGRPGSHARLVGPDQVKGSWWRHWTMRKALAVVLGGIGAIIVLGAIAVAVAYEETPVPSEAMAATGYTQSVVYSSNGTLIGRFGNINRQMLAYNQIPQTMINAVLAAEDRHFWTEGGISPSAILRAAFTDVKGGDGLQGGSTITQQFVRNYYQGIGTQQTFGRKIKEIFVSMKIGKDKSKQWILANYLNTIYLGDGAYGIEAAAETYFGKRVGQLSVAQDAVIAAMIQQPSSYPLKQYRPQLEARWHYVLSGMVSMGVLPARQAASVKFPALGDYVPQSFGSDVWDPYVLNMVYNELTQVYGFTKAQIFDGGYVIRTTIDDQKMAALYQAVEENVAQIDAGGTADSFKSYMHVGAVLEDPATGAIEALYPGPGYPGWKYNGTGRVISAKECRKIDCEVNMAVYNREQVGSSFKPYILATAVKQGMNVQTSTLYGSDDVCIPPETAPTAYPVAPIAGTDPARCPIYQYYFVPNDDAGENQAYTAQTAMAQSINTAYTDLWHVVAGPTGMNVANMAKLFGVDTDAACITVSCGPKGHQVAPMKDEAGLALGQASLTVGEQASMLATIDDNGVYHDAHVISSISRNGVQTPIEITSYPVFSPGDPTANAEEDSQVQYAMSQDTVSGTATSAAMSNGQEIIAKTGTTNTAQSAFFIGAIPSQTLAVALFTSNQSGACPPAPKICQTLNNLGGLEEGGYGGTWPAAIWHTYAENMFVPLGVEPFQPAVFTGSAWNLVPPNLRKTAKPHKTHQNPTQPTRPIPWPTNTCSPEALSCAPSTPDGQPSQPAQPFGGGNTQAVNATAGAAVGGVFVALPAACLWVRRRTRRRRRDRG
jgi:membrane peptidoglycan carboxypeptidase